MCRRTKNDIPIRERWEVEFSLFFGYPPLTSTCPDLVPLPMKARNRRPIGNWFSASSAAMLQLISDHSSSDVILTVCYRGKIQEEHYVLKLLFTWPQEKLKMILFSRCNRLKRVLLCLAFRW